METVPQRAGTGEACSLSISSDFVHSTVLVVMLCRETSQGMQERPASSVTSGVSMSVCVSGEY